MSKELIINESPVKTTVGFGINNLKIKDYEDPEVKEFKNIIIEDPENTVTHEKNTFKFKYGMGDYLLNQSNTMANINLRIKIEKNIKEPIIIRYHFDKENDTLIDNILVESLPKKKANIYIIYTSDEDVKAYHNGICQTELGEESNIHVSIINLLNLKSNNFYTVETDIPDRAKSNFSMVEFGGKINAVNYYASTTGYKSYGKLNSIYLGKEDQIIDLNYISELYGKESKADMDINGALRDRAKKIFKGDIDFKTGNVDGEGHQAEYCILLDDTARSKSLPMLLCTEEYVEGEHASATGKIDPESLFYIMSRGFSEHDAKKMIIKAKFNDMIVGLKNEEFQKMVIDEVDKRLDS